MNLHLAVIFIGAVEDEGTFWIQLLMIVILAAGAGAYVLFKSRTKRVEHRRDVAIETIIRPSAASIFEPPSVPALSKVEPPKPVIKSKDIAGGMELLARDFLVNVVEQTDSLDQRDIAMRKLCFAELSRRGELASIASSALKVYTLDEDGFYGKVIRCEAMAELAGRTAREATDNKELNNIPPVIGEPASSGSHRME